jgi:glutamate--cysteine ligase regulatory subunit
VVDVDTSGPKRKSEDRVLIVPKVVDMSPPVACKTDRSKIDVTAKLFLGRIAYSEEPSERDTRNCVDDALRWLEAATCVKELETFIVSLPGVKWEGDELIDKDGMSEVDTLAKVWPYIAQKPALRKLGVADFSAAHIERLLELTEEGTRRISVNQVNIDQDGTLPECLMQVAKREQVQVLTHSDDLGTKQQLIGLLKEFEDRLPLPQGFGQKTGEGGDVAESVLRVDWVLKYTILIRDRGLVADKGYIVAATFL